MKILVTGDREWNNAATIIDAFEKVCADFEIEPTEMILIHGNARGADKMAGQIGEELGMKVRKYPANWSRYGTAAGPIRNQEMLDDNSDITLALAFHPNLEESKGTRDMIIRLKKAGIEYRHYK